MAALPPGSVNGTTIIKQISLAVYLVINETKVRHPEYFVEKYRLLEWESPKVQRNFVQGFTAGLSQQPADLLTIKVDQYLRKLFLPEFFESREFKQLHLKVSQLVRLLINTSLNQVIQSNSLSSALRHDSSTGTASRSDAFHTEASASSSPDGGGMAVLLLDVENMRLNQPVEAFLSTVCTYPIRIKIAIANWRLIGKQDIEFHQRGYQMIHVPSGTNSADMKMTAIGSSIFLRYPNMREVLICSSDSDLTHLCHTLSSHGLTVYSVRKQRDGGLMVTNLETSAVYQYEAEPEPEMPALPDLIRKLKALIYEEQEKTQQQWVRLSKIPNLFYQATGLPVSRITAHHGFGKKFTDFVTEHPRDFAMCQLAGESSLYITAFEMDENDTEPPIPLQDGIIRTKGQLRQILVDYIVQLVQESSENLINLGVLATAFNQDYGSVKQAMKYLGITGTLPSYLKSIEVLEVFQDEKGYWVSLIAPVLREEEMQGSDDEED